MMKSKLPLLGGLSVNEFLRDYWQKKPLLIRHAIPRFNGLIDQQQLISLACTDDVQARLVTQRQGKFILKQAPFEPADLDNLGKTKWTVLVQGVNHHLPQAAALLKQFSFIPHARLDDLMVSYAPKGGEWDRILTPTMCSCCRVRDIAAGRFPRRRIAV